MSQPASIDGAQFARSGSSLSGRLSEGDLPRLESLGCSAQDGVEFRIDGLPGRQGRARLRVSAKGRLWLVCQRCLGPVESPVSIVADLELASSLREIEEADDDVDRVLASGQMDVATLVEDEMILVLPMVPRHSACAEDAALREQGRESPFLALAKLKNTG